MKREHILASNEIKAGIRQYLTQDVTNKQVCDFTRSLVKKYMQSPSEYLTRLFVQYACTKYNLKKLKLEIHKELHR